MSEMYSLEQKRFLLELVRNTIKSKLEGGLWHGNTINAPKWLQSKQSCFVTLHTKRRTAPRLYRKHDGV